MKHLRLIGLLSLLAVVGGCAAASEAGNAKAIEFFENKIRPVLAEKCYSCHSAREGNNKGGLPADTPIRLRFHLENGDLFSYRIE